MPFTFKVGSKIKEAWPLYKDNLGMFLLLLVATFAFQMIGEISDKSIILSILLMLVSIVFSYIWAKSGLDLTAGKPLSPFSKETLPNLSQLWDFIKTNILLMLCVLGGAILLIIPAFYVAGRLFPAMYLSVEKSQGARKNIKEAWAMTKGRGWYILWKSFLIGLFVLLGFLALVVGAIITYPIGMIVSVMMYREIVKSKSGDVAVSSNDPIITEVKVEEKIEEVKEAVVAEKVEENVA